jgi:hypothetical protein
VRAQENIKDFVTTQDGTIRHLMDEVAEIQQLMAHAPSTRPPEVPEGTQPAEQEEMGEEGLELEAVAPDGTNDAYKRLMKQAAAINRLYKAVYGFGQAEVETCEQVLEQVKQIDARLGEEGKRFDSREEMDAYRLTKIVEAGIPANIYQQAVEQNKRGTFTEQIERRFRGQNRLFNQVFHQVYGMNVAQLQAYEAKYVAQALAIEAQVRAEARGGSQTEEEIMTELFNRCEQAGKQGLDGMTPSTLWDAYIYHKNKEGSDGIAQRASKLSKTIYGRYPFQLVEYERQGEAAKFLHDDVSKSQEEWEVYLREHDIPEIAYYAYVNRARMEQAGIISWGDSLETIVNNSVTQAQLDAAHFAHLDEFNSLIAPHVDMGDLGLNFQTMQELYNWTHTCAKILFGDHYRTEGPVLYAEPWGQLVDNLNNHSGVVFELLNNLFSGATGPDGNVVPSVASAVNERGIWSRILEITLALSQIAEFPIAEFSLT